MVAAQIKNTYEQLGDSVDCTAKAFLLAYFLRVDSTYAKTKLEKTFPTIGNPFRGCEATSMEIALDRDPSSDVEQFAISRLWNANLPSQYPLLKRSENTDQETPKDLSGSDSKNGIKAGRVALHRRIPQETRLSCR